MEYEVKWVGYNSSENTWEEVKNLQNCPDLVKEYEKKAKTHARALKSASTIKKDPLVMLNVPQKNKK